MWCLNAKFVVGVTGVVRDDEGRVLLLRHRMWPPGRQWGLPSGFAHKGEDFRRTLVREIKEETNLDAPEVTVIARVLPAHRRQGFGEELYARGLERARTFGAEVIETVVLASNEDGLRFAQKHGFVEVERYVLPGDTVPWITLRLT
jgi:ADP-ribose pyrophosphatase YjhB (NUDIX family)